MARLRDPAARRGGSAGGSRTRGARPDGGCAAVHAERPRDSRAPAVTTRQPLPSAPSAQFRRRRFIEVAGERFRNLSIAPPLRASLRRFYHAALLLQTGGRGLRCTLPNG